MNTEKTIVKISTESPTWSLVNQLPKNGYENYQFDINIRSKECDYWFVFDGLQQDETCLCPKENTIFTTWEPPTFRTYSEPFIKQFSTLVTCHTNLNHPHILWYQQSNPWYIKNSYEELVNYHPVKTKEICLITSTKLYTDGHRARLDFAYKLKELMGYRMDLFGRGIQDFTDKRGVLHPYKYAVVIENSQHEDYFTEKLTDTYLMETYPFYFGCKNIQSYFPLDSYFKIDLPNPRGTYLQILNILENKNHYQKVLPKIQEAKDLVMGKHSLFPSIKAYVDHFKLSDANKKVITIQKEKPLFLNEQYLKSITPAEKLYKFYIKRKNETTKLFSNIL